MKVVVLLNIYRRNKRNLYLFVLTALISLWFWNKSIFFTIGAGQSTVRYHFALTLILTGVVMIQLSIMTISLRFKRIETLNHAGYMDDSFNGVFISLLGYVGSMTCMLPLVLNINQLDGLFNLSVFFFLFGTIFLLKSILHNLLIVNMIREQSS